eukprot:20535-Eustigmatos_ZCMA.PRE.1
MASYYRRFVVGFAHVASPLFNLLKKNVQHHWSKACQAAFDRIKKALTTAPCLAFPDWSKPFVLYTDASDIGLGAVLSQVSEEGQEVNIAYLSRVMDKHEKHYS